MVIINKHKKIGGQIKTKYKTNFWGKITNK